MKIRRRGTSLVTRQHGTAERARLLSRFIPERWVAGFEALYGPVRDVLAPVLGWVRRWLFPLLIALFVGWVALVGELRVVALGAVDARVVHIAAGFPSQITSVEAACDTRIAAGTVLATVRNEIMVQQYRTEYARVEAELSELRNARGARVTAADEAANAADHEHRAAVKVRENVQSLRAATEPLWKTRQVTLNEWLDIDNSWVKAVSSEASTEASWRSRLAEAERTRLELKEQIAGLEARRAELLKLTEISGRNELRAGIDGTVTSCERRPGEVVAAGETIMEVQGNEVPTILAYINTADMDRVTVGQPGLVYLSTGGDPLRATITALPVQVGRLPGKLKRYFWQGQEWQQYAPVRLSLDAGQEQRVAGLRYNERVDVLFLMHPSVPVPLWLLNIF